MAGNGRLASSSTMLTGGRTLSIGQPGAPQTVRGPDGPLEATCFACSRRGGACQSGPITTIGRFVQLSGALFGRPSQKCFPSGAPKEQRPGRIIIIITNIISTIIIINDDLCFGSKASVDLRQRRPRESRRSGRVRGVCRAQSVNRNAASSAPLERGT